MWYKRKWIEAHFRSPFFRVRKTHTGAFKRGQQFYVAAIKLLPSWKGCKKVARKGDLCLSEKHEMQAFTFFAISAGGLHDGGEKVVEKHWTYKQRTHVYTYTTSQRLKKVKYDLNIAAQENALKH